ncbi:hypothetical protein SLH46_19690 [Draconibacterium sp. IB214405]|uniref:hypothetical protein n=1 Tax=Draconibacterium sp. IB214405 TaxID=3097352 RepID=UPI002A11BCA4|nr:hypothetical protein [Draconibacterium sp. IB214405]MDX8341431.1 hypothetical protein [Draconibacterium sp. IB214405]
MNFKHFFNFGIALLFFYLVGCTKEEQSQALGENMFDPCGAIEFIAKNRDNCHSNIVLQSYVNEYTFTEIESSYYALGPQCEQNRFTIKYINSTHDHNEPDLEFGFYLPKYPNSIFFKKDTFNIDTIYYREWRPSGGHGGPRYDAEAIFIWDEVEINDTIYSGKGKFILNKEIPVNYPATYFFPAQEIPFEFCNK